MVVECLFFSAKKVADLNIDLLGCAFCLDLFSYSCIFNVRKVNSAEL